MDKPNGVVCDICALSFDSQDTLFCQKCEAYNEALELFGKTKSNLDYVTEYGMKSLLKIAQEIGGGEYYGKKRPPK